MRTIPLLVALSLLLPACGDELEGNCGDGLDDDQDGLVDCDDPDCSGQAVCTEEDTGCEPLTWYQDSDADGFGSETTTQACSQPSGYVDDSSDCDDTDAAIHPDADEVCDGADNDCDGSVDGEDALDPLTSYQDADVDGYGDATVTQWSCDPPSGYVSQADDCDDSDADSYPGAPDTCHDGVDQDCSGTDATCTLWGEIDLDTQAVGWSDSDDSLGATGMAVAIGDHLDEDGRSELLVSTPYYEFGKLMSRLWIVPIRSGVSGGSLSMAGSVDGAYAITGIQLRDGAGMYSSSGIGDFDGDEQADLVVGSPGWESSGLGTYSADDDEGRVYLVEGPIEAGALDELADVVIEGDQPMDRLGYLVYAVGDVDGTGADDLVVTSDRNLDTLLFSDPLLGPTTAYPADALASFEGLQTASQATDLNGDGLADLCIGSGVVQVYWGPMTAEGDLSGDDADLVITGTGSPAQTGDVDGDGLPDLLLRVPYATVGDDSNTGVADLVTGASLAELVASSQTEAAIDEVLHARIQGDVADQFLAASGLIVGDTNHDGFAELAVGSSYDDVGSANAGVVYLFFGPVAGILSASDDADATIRGSAESESLGYSLAGADMDADGAADLVVGAPGRWASAGGALLLFGGGSP